MIVSLSIILSSCTEEPTKVSGPKEGQGRTAVSYQDADDLPA